jgi:hypothetical protein
VGEHRHGGGDCFGVAVGIRVEEDLREIADINRAGVVPLVLRVDWEPRMRTILAFEEQVWAHGAYRACVSGRQKMVSERWARIATPADISARWRARSRKRSKSVFMSIRNDPSRLGPVARASSGPRPPITIQLSACAAR